MKTMKQIDSFSPEVEVKNICNWIKEYFVANGPGCNAIIGISGGKDSTVAAALLVEALGKERVIGVQMPNGKQHDIDMSDKVISLLGIKSIKVNIGETCDKLYETIGKKDCIENSVVTSNTPARLRMTTLYAIAAMHNGRVVNTCNRSEDYVGYSTKFGDAAGDFALLKAYTVTEIKKIGRYLNLPDYLINKVPEDGMCGKTDEENLGFSYDALDDFILNNNYPNVDTYEKIQKLHKNSRHKENPIPVCGGYMDRRGSRRYFAYDDSWSF